MDYTLSIQSLFEFVNAEPSSRCINEGQAVLNAGHIFLHGIEERSNTFIKVYGLCLKSSGLQKEPHELRIILNILKDKRIEVKSAICSCKAGNSSKCKHVTALLMLCTRQNVTTFEKLSSTDIACKWKKVQTATLEKKYATVPIADDPCVKKAKMGNCSRLEEMDFDDKKDFILNKLQSAAPTSALVKHRNMQRKSAPFKNSIGEGEICEQIKIICEHAANSQFLAQIFKRTPEEECCGKFFEELVPESFCSLADLTKKDKLIWSYERKYRITGSRCYDLYTYRKNNWTEKCLNYLNPKKISNKYILHGIAFEAEARETYGRTIDGTVVETGLIVSVEHPWLGYSPDGVVMNSNGKPIKLLEIKCPYIGKESSASEFYKLCSFLKIDDQNTVELKKNHKYYGQIQLGMAMLNITTCDFVVYSSKHKDFLLLSVDFDEEFTSTLIQRLQNVYFDYMLPQICRMKSKGSTHLFDETE